MKKLIFIAGLALAALSCKNAHTSYDDYTQQTIYFPIQYPIRTLSLGNDLVDNSLDRQHKFHIGVCVGGFYDNNNRDWRVDFAVDPSLVPTDSLLRSNGSGDTIRVLPPSYYTLNPSQEVVIPKGSFSGLIEVQLTDAFFQDPEAITGAYVIPLRITGSPDTQNILRGVPADGASTPPDVNVAAQWTTLPKDYTLFGVKYVNPYHGNWLRRGQLTVRDQTGQIVATKIYHAQYVEYNEVVSLVTASMTAVTSTMSTDTTTLNLRMDVDAIGQIAITGNGQITIPSAAAGTPALPISVSYGTGQYKENGDTWGGTPENPTPRDAIYLDYFYKRPSGGATLTCEVCDTLVFRDRGIAYEDDRPTPLY